MHGYFERALGFDRSESPVVPRAMQAGVFQKPSRILMCFVCVLCLAQGAIALGNDQAKDETRKPDAINSGFVFVDGKYLDAPYRVEARDLAVYVNGVQASRKEVLEPYKKYCFDHDPAMPKGLTRNMSLEDCAKVKEPGGQSFIDAKMGYLFTHFGYEEAFKKAVEFYRSLPCVKSLEQDERRFWVLTENGGRKICICIASPNMRRVNKIYGPGGTGPEPRKYYEERVELVKQQYEQYLKDNKCLLIFIYKRGVDTFDERECAAMLPKVIEAMRSKTLSDKGKRDKLVSLGFFPESTNIICDKFISNFGASLQLDKRANALVEEVKKKYGPGAQYPTKEDQLKEIQQKER